MGKFSVRSIRAIVGAGAFLLAATAIANEYVLIPRTSTESSVLRFYAKDVHTGERRLFNLYCHFFYNQSNFYFEDDDHFDSLTITRQPGKKCKDVSSFLHQPLEFTDNKSKSLSVTLKEISPGTALDQYDFKTIATVNELFKEPKEDYFGTTSFQHGKKTAKVIVFVHGLAMHSGYYRDQAIEAYKKGHNVIVGHLPGHFYNGFVETNAKAGVWLQYTEWLALIAKQYGEEVVYVGHSLGGHLGIRLAERGLIDKLILSQPLAGLGAVYSTVLPMSDLGVTHKAKALSEKIGIKLPKFNDFLMAANQAIALSKMPYKKIPARIKVITFLSPLDVVVDNEKTKAWIQQFAPQAELRETTPTRHIFDHMKHPLDLADHY